MKLKALLDLEINSKSKEVIEQLLIEEGFEVQELPKKELIVDEITKGHYHIVFLNCYMCRSCADTIGLTINKVKELDPRIEIIAVGENEDTALVIEAIKNGATACFGKPLELTLLKKIIGKIIEVAKVRKDVYEGEKILHEKYIFADMVSKSPAMFEIFSLIRRVAPYYGTMLLSGETGTGKEVLAKAVHQLSPVSNEPFVACNCSGLVETLIESELFGHVKGAFTGAVSDKKGLFEAAGSGTIFLDDIGDIPFSFQSHFLRVLQDGEFRRVGSTQSMHAKCRVIAATSSDLSEKLKKGLFREDLYFRLAVIDIKLPPLRERKEDIPLLCRFFLKRFKKKFGKEIRGITTSAQRLLMSYDWLGNVRELENVLERAMLVTTNNLIRPQDLPAYIHKIKPDISMNLTLDEIEKNHIQRVLITAGSNKTKTASMLGISRRALLRKIYKYRLS